jgi:hypothetical protein
MLSLPIGAVGFVFYSLSISVACGGHLCAKSHRHRQPSSHFGGYLGRDNGLWMPRVSSLTVSAAPFSFSSMRLNTESFLSTFLNSYSLLPCPLIF